MKVEIAAARHTAEVERHDYYFCCARCRPRFVKEPRRYLAPRHDGPRRHPRALPRARLHRRRRVRHRAAADAALEKPLLIEGPAGVGKTESAKVLAEVLGTRLIRLQCYEGSTR